MAMEALKKTVLSKFSAEVGENVANLMIKEVVANVDRPGMGVRLVEEGELEWIMQVIDYSLQLGLANNRDFETVQSAVRVYVAWLTTITSSPHPSAPTPMIKSPLNYFSRLLDSLLAIFLPRSTENLFPPTIINRQAAEIRQVLGAVRVLYKRAEMAQKENIVEMWSRILLFLKSANSILLSKPCWPDELGSVMAGDLSENLFDCWVVAAIQGRIPTKSYWKMLSINAQQWITHVPVIEWWGRKLLALTVIVVKKSFGEDYCDIKLTDDIYNNIDLSDLKEIWWQLFTLFGNVSKIPGQAEKICLENGTSPNLGLVVAEQAGLSFFLTLEIMARIVSIFNADVTVSLDLHENDDIMAQCIEYQNVNGTSSNGTRFQRQSNMSTTSSNFSTAVDKNEESQSTLTSVQHQSGNLKKIQIAMNSQGSAKNGSLGKPIVNPSPVPNRNAKFSAKAGLHHAVSLQTDIILEQSVGSGSVESHSILKPNQLVWNVLKCNKFHQSIGNPDKKPSASTLLNLMLPWLRDSARVPASPTQRKYSEDVISQRSLSSVELDPQMSTDGPVSRRSFAGSANSASDISQHNTTAYSNSSVDPSTIPAVDGVSAGKSAAIGALCRIVCSKSSNEVIPEEQMAQFLVVLHEALVERDRLMLCSLVFYSTELFKLGLNGVEILLPNYVTAIDILLTESFKLRLHPSINEIDMRHSCLRALASVIAWPTTFGQDKITAFDEGVSLTKGNNNVLGVGMKYDELRPRILRTLVYALRNETDSMNLQLALGLCHSFCAENANYEIESLDEEKVFAVSALRQTISAVCDNLCKPQWCAELGTSLAAFDCLNALSTLPTKLLFYEGDHSTGTLILSSLCRFVNSQLQKPPPFHSRDLHSSVVAAFQSLEVWLCAAPILAEVESVISTVANTVEFGMTGGTGLSTEQYKPASQRVHDAAESLHYTLFGSVGANDCMTMVDEHSVIRKLGDDNVSLKGFQHFIVDKFSLLSVHNLTHADFVSNGQPTVVMVCRTPYQPAHATLVQLKSRVEYDENADVLNNNRIEITDKNGVLIEKVNDNQETAPKPPKHKAEIPAECFKIECELDKNIQQKPPTDQSKQVEDELSKIRKRLAEGAVSPLSDRDQKNVWSTASLDSELCASPKPAEPFKKCNAVRVFLYDMGLLDRKTFGQDLIALDSTHTTDFFDALHCQIDRQPAKKCETVSIFYVRRGQRSFSEILKNTEHLETTSKSFVGLISRLGRIRRTREPGFWTGHWQTAFSPPPSLDSDPFSRTSESESHSLDGLENCIWWSDSQLEIAYQLPSERSLQRNLQYIHGDVKEDSYSVPAKQVTINCLQLHINVGEAMVKVNRPQISPSQRLLIHQDNLLPVDDSESIISDYNDTIHKRNMMASLGSTVSIHPGMLSIDVGPTPGSTEPPRSARFSPTARARILARQKTVDYTRYTTPENTTRKTSDSALNKNMSLQMSVAPNTLITNRPNIDNEYENEDGSRYRTAGRNSVGHYDTERQDTAGSNPVRRYEKLHGTAGKSESVRQYDTETLKAADQDTLKHYDKGIQRRYTSPSTNSIDSMGLSSPSDRASTGIASPNDSPRNRAQTNPRYEKVRDRQYSKSSKYDRYFENDLSLTASQKRTGLAQLGTATQNKSTSSPKSKLQMAASPKNKWKMAAEIGLQESRNAKMASGQNLKLTSPTSQTSKESPSSQSSTTTPASPTTSKTKPTKPATPTPLTQQSSFSYIKSFFKRKNTEDSAGGSFAKPEPMLKTLSEVTEEELEEMFPRMPSQSSKEQKGTLEG